jgi:hypothetical protein
MWLNNWMPNDLYTSRYTKCSYSPYEDTFRRRAPYCGRALLADLESIILSFRPTTIYSPHPSDQHTDHWGVHCFVTQALYELNMADDVRTGLYIVHRGNWPVPEGLHPTKPLAPPAFLDETGMDWYSHPLDKEHMALKLRAIRSYRTQLPYMGEYLYSFDRRNELFSEYEPADIPYVSGPPSGDPDRFWNHIEPCVLDPVEDSIRVEMGRAGDIKQVKACFDDENVYVRVELARTHSRRLHYGVQVFGLPDATSGRVKLSVSGKGRDMHDAGARLSGDTADFTIPLSRLGRWDALMISADTSIEGRRVDRCAWRVLLSRGGDPTRLPSLQAAGHRDRPPPLSPARKSL